MADVKLRIRLHLAQHHADPAQFRCAEETLALHLGILADVLSVIGAVRTQAPHLGEAEHLRDHFEAAVRLMGMWRRSWWNFATSALDDGLHLFPSVHGATGGIASEQLGKLTGDMTERGIGVRIPIHRLRDTLATEVSENLLGGTCAAKTLLRHVDERVTQRHDDLSEGLKAAGEFDDFVESRRTVTTDLLV